MAKFKPRFSIGDRILVRATVEGKCDHNGERRVRRTEPSLCFEAVVTGYGSIQEGEVVGDYFRESYLAQTSVVRVVKFRTYLLQKEQCAMESDCLLLQISIVNENKIPYGRPASQKQKELASEVMKQEYKNNHAFFPRDSKGRFVPMSADMHPRPSCAESQEA